MELVLLSHISHKYHMSDQEQTIRVVAHFIKVQCYSSKLYVDLYPFDKYLKNLNIVLGHGT